MEAVIAFVGFLFVIFTILNVTNYCRAQMLISNAMDTVTKELTQYSYFYKASGLQKFGEEIRAIGAEGEANLNTIATSVGDLYTAMSGAVDTTLAEGAGLGDRLSSGNIDIQDLNNALTNVDASFTNIDTKLNDMNTKFMDVYNNPVLYMKSLVAVAGNEGLELAKSHVLAAPLAKGLLLKHFGSNKDEADKALEQLGIVDGIDGMNFNMSTIFTKEHPDEIHLVVYYTVELSQMFDWLDLKVNMCKETRARAWLAGDHPVASNVKPAEPPAGGGAGGGAADPNTPEEPATPTAEELKAQMVAKYGQETIDAVCADADTSGWTEQDWEYQIWLYQHREEIEEVAGKEEIPEGTPDEEYIKNVMIVIYGPLMVSYVDIIEDTEGWTMQMWQAKIESYLLLYGELGTEMVALYGKEEVGEVRAAEDTSGWTREQWIAKLNENREKKEEEDETESGINSYADFSKAIRDIGMRSDLTDAQKISELQKLFESSKYKADINVPSDIQYVKGFDAKGNVIYDWPPKLGFDESTIKSISRTDSLPDTWDRYGYMGGSNFADVPPTGKYTYSERAIPYVENEAAYHTGTFNNATYFDKIDAIKNKDIDTFNKLLQNEGISKWDLDDFEELCDNYESFISKANKELGGSIDATYGIKGIAAKWGDMSGGAGQIVTPFGGDVLEKIGILKEN